MTARYLMRRATECALWTIYIMLFSSRAGYIRLPLAAAAAAVTPLKIRCVQEAVKRCKTPHNKNSKALPTGRGALPYTQTHTPSSWT